MMEIKGENPFKIRAYFSGARTLQTMEEDLGTVIEEGRLSEVPGIGKALTEKIETLFATGELEFYDKLLASVPPGLLDLLGVPGLGGKKIKALHEQLDVDSIESLTEACNEGKVAQLKGFGEKTQEKILSGIKNREAYAARHLWWQARKVADRILPGLQGLASGRASRSGRELPPGNGNGRRPRLSGRLLRPRSDHGLVHLHGGDRRSHRSRGHQVEHPSGRRDAGRSAGRAGGTVLLRSASFYRFQGPQRPHAPKSPFPWPEPQRMGPASRGGKDSSRKAGPVEARSEEDIFKALGLQYVPPALREGMGEVEAAERNELPELLEYSDLKGCFHNHTTASDGRNTLDEMTAEADARGWEYLGIADHSKSSFQANGLDEERLAKQVAAIRELNESGKYRCHVFAGSEVERSLRRKTRLRGFRTRLPRLRRGFRS